ncbi:hypothetical protein GGX14DRAFT_555594 [Mycena pura]|uniref:Uncharacterized protein n=1 Tax=Mycena pura TaxID=153505 RepID=A0AAD6YRC3_9AGAR|nr:hypothetical protein GGX14DRAFT_555594 [Mycena pura]
MPASAGSHWRPASGPASIAAMRFAWASDSVVVVVGAACHFEVGGVRSSFVDCAADGRGGQCGLHGGCGWAANAVRCTGSHAAHHYAPVLTLAFIGTLMSYTPFPLADVASTWLALVRTCRLALPAVLMDCLAGEQARLAHVAALRAQLAAAGGGDASLLVAYHVLGPAEVCMRKG